MSQQEIVIAIDAMGGDYAPKEIVLGAIQAAKEFNDIKILLVGKIAEIQKILDKQKTNDLNIELIDAPEDISMEEKNPARAVRKAQNSSVVIANKLVKAGKAHAVIAAGHTGAATAASLFEIGRIDGFDRPCICTLIPNLQDVMLLIDGGSNIEATAEHMHQSAILGNILAKILFDKANPRVGLLNIGEEEGKGTELYKKTYELIKNTSGINFVGNVEGKTIIDDLCEVAVCDGFVGNMHLKALEGGLKLFASEIRKQIKMAGPLGIIAGLLLKITGVFDKLKARFHPNSYGGALLGGIDGVSIISHGSSNAEAIKNACKQARLLVSKDVINKVKRELV